MLFYGNLLSFVAKQDIRYGWGRLWQSGKVGIDRKDGVALWMTGGHLLLPKYSQLTYIHAPQKYLGILHKISQISLKYNKMEPLGWLGG